MHKSENIWSGKYAIFKPFFKLTLEIALCYVRTGHIAYQSRFSKSSRLRIPRFDSSKYYDEDRDALTYLLHEYTKPYEDKYPVQEGSQGSASTTSTASSMESVSSNPMNPNHMVPFYFKMYVHQNREIFWKYMCPANRYLIVEDSCHHPPNKLQQLALKMILEDAIDTFTPKRQEAKTHDFVLDSAQMTLYGTEKSDPIVSDIGKITMHYSQCPFKAVLSQCIYHIKNRLSLLQFKFKNQCSCEKVFHLYLMHYDE